MGQSQRRIDDSGSHRLAAIEDFKANAFLSNAEGLKFRLHVRHEAIRAAEIDLRFSPNASLFEERSRQVTGGVVIFTQLISRARAAVADIASAACERAYQPSNFGDKGMMSSISRRVQP
jgi:hypothetical protein